MKISQTQNEGMGLPGKRGSMIHTFKKLIIFIVIALLLYCSAYGVARWRKCIVMAAYNQKGENLLVLETAPGIDIRDNWKGHLKNKINPIFFVVFRPLELLENHFRGSKRQLPHTASSPPHS